MRKIPKESISRNNVFNRITVFLFPFMTLKGKERCFTRKCHVKKIYKTKYFRYLSKNFI